MNSLIEIENMSFGYDKILLNNINLNINKGDFLGIIGSNGTGKSTLLKIILGQIKPDKGKVIIENNNNEASNIGYVKQMNKEKVVSFPITPLEIVKLNLFSKMDFFKISNKRLDSTAINALTMVNLEDKIYYNYNNMSGGEQQRVLIAKSLVNNPEILIFDEPTAGIDNESKIILFDILSHLNKFHNITIIIVTHELEFSKKYFSRILELKNGNLHDYKEEKVCWFLNMILW